MTDDPKPAKKRNSRNKVLPPLRVTDSEREAILTKARQAGLSTSEYQRRACLNDRAIRTKTQDMESAEALRLLLIAGNNLNQLARRINAGQGVSNVAVNDTLSELQNAIRKVAGS